jgi:large subunit ribosomal protein L18
MRVQIRKHLAPKQINRVKKKLRVRKKVEGTTERPRLSFYRSTRNFYAQIIDDTTGKTLFSVSTLKVEKGANIESAKNLGAEIAQKAVKANCANVVFDRNGYLYHGKVKAFAEAAREAGLKF